MRIGWISESLPYLPSRGGFRLYGGNLIRTLSKRHQIDLISFLRDDDSQHLDWPQRYCATVEAICLMRLGSLSPNPGAERLVSLHWALRVI